VNTRAVRALGDRFLTMDGSLLTQRHRRWAFVMRQRRAIRPVKLSGTAELAVAEFGAVTPKRGRSLVVKGDMTLCISHVDGGRKCLDCIPIQPINLGQDLGLCLAGGGVSILELFSAPCQRRLPRFAPRKKLHALVTGVTRRDLVSFSQGSEPPIIGKNPEARQSGGPSSAARCSIEGVANCAMQSVGPEWVNPGCACRVAGTSPSPQNSCPPAGLVP
jgi:hypothetical protein